LQCCAEKQWAVKVLGHWGILLDGWYAGLCSIFYLAIDVGVQQQQALTKK